MNNPPKAPTLHFEVCFITPIIPFHHFNSWSTICVELVLELNRSIAQSIRVVWRKNFLIVAAASSTLCSAYLTNYKIQFGRTPIKLKDWRNMHQMMNELNSRPIFMVGFTHFTCLLNSNHNQRFIIYTSKEVMACWNCNVNCSFL